MEIRLLGPFELCIDETPAPTPGRGERALLALLALAAGQVVAASSLIDALWDAEKIPEDPGNALHLRVSKLRRALSAAGQSDVVRRDGAGYRLDVSRESVDAHRFAALIDKGRRSGDPLEAVEIYNEALRLWRGVPLVDFAGEPWTIVDVGRFSELRLAAVAERAERLLTLGRFNDLVVDLEPVVSEAPTRERLVGLLMTGLFNSGRQAEALELFTRTRSLLADELGIDPSRELRAVMEGILRQDDSASAARIASPTSQTLAAPAAGRSPAGLPARSTSFIGRELEVARIIELLTTSRLVTAAGPGGTGKTSLAVESARAMSGAYRDGAVFVRLAAITEPEQVSHAIADAMGINIEGGTTAHRPRDVLLRQVRSHQTLLVIDNCEHLIESVAKLVEAILASCPDIKVLATSREILAIPGEVQVPVRPLEVPAPDTSTADLTSFPSVQLFLDRATSVIPDLDISEPTIRAAAVVCQRLDGIPLALELAAAQLGSLNPIDLAERLSDRLALTSVSRTAEARQQTLRATVDWSYNLLSELEQQLFRRLATFRGGWTVEAAERVVSGSDLPQEMVLSLLDRLVRQSLVVASRGTQPTRFRMLETLRQYAADQLEQTEENSAVLAAHANYFLDLAEQAEIGLRGHSQLRWRRMLDEEHDNLRAALNWFAGPNGRSDGALELAGSLGMYWQLGRHLEGRETLRRVLRLQGTSPSARARAMQALAIVERPRACVVHPSEQCAAAARSSMETFEAEGDSRRAAFSRLLLAVEGVGPNPPVDAGELLAAADGDFIELGDEWGRAMVAFVEMETSTRHGDQVTAAEAANRAISRFREIGDPWGLSAVLYHRAWGLAWFGQHEEAVALYREVLEAGTAAGVTNTVQWATSDLGLSLLALGRVDEASECFTRAASLPDEVGDDLGRYLAAYGEALVAQRADDLATARDLFAEAECGFDRLGIPSAQAKALIGLAACHENAGDCASATSAYARVISMGDATGDPNVLAIALEGSARLRSL